jgi:2-polyprenyl-6-methoxyphenol hydroxylase-like FAD-dependent oxidoreductase
MISVKLCQFKGLMMKTILIAGAGIGGLTAGIALKQAGFDVRLFEEAGQQREIGAGLWMWQNAMRTLDSLGVGDAVRASGVRNAHGGVRNWRGDVLVQRIPSNAIYESVAILRADLQSALASALDVADIRYGAAVRGFGQDGQGATLKLGNGEEVRGDALIGADGIYSAVRRQLSGDVPLKYAGFSAWRGVVPFAHDRIPTGILWGSNARFGFMPVRGGLINWFAGRRIAARTPDAEIGRKQELLQRYAGWAEPIEAAIAATDDADILRHDIYTAPRLKAWSQGRVALLGDAAHSMTPSIGQGACQAIEDAVTLARCLRDHDDVVAGLEAYQRIRMPRAYAIARYSRFMDWVSLWGAPFSVVRNVVIRMVPDVVRDRQMEWIIRGDKVSHTD